MDSKETDKGAIDKNTPNTTTPQVNTIKMDVTQEIALIDEALDRVQTDRKEHLRLVNYLNTVILAVNSEDGFCRIKEPTEQ